MLATGVFWCATIALLICAMCFFIPSLWLTTTDVPQISAGMRLMYSGLLVLLLVIFSYYIYLRFGAVQYLSNYYSANNMAQYKSHKQIRPLYARIQRELIKSSLDLKLELDNVELILNFAQLHSQSQQGLLQPEVQQLLNAVLKAIPQQITALNLLAINAYKTEQYSQAIEYWQEILQQFTPEMRNTQVERILQDKILATKTKLSLSKYSDL